MVVEPVSGFEPLTVRLQGHFIGAVNCCFPGQSWFFGLLDYPPMFVGFTPFGHAAGTGI
jgi:hypothetical protein